MELPEQEGLLPDVTAIDTVGATVADLLMVIEFDVAVTGFAHADEEVMIQLTTSEFVKAELVNVALFVPASVVLTFH